MKTLYLLMMKLRKQIWFQILIVLELTAALTLFLIVFGKMEYYARPLKAFGEQNLSNCFILGNNSNMGRMPQEKRSDQEIETAYIEKLDAEMAKHPEVVRYGTTYEGSAGFRMEDINDQLKEQLKYTIEENRSYAWTTIYDEVVAKNLKLPLSAGKQLTDVKMSEDVIPAIFKHEFSKTLKIGEVYEVDLRWYSRLERPELHYSDDGNSVSSSSIAEKNPICIQVCGFLERDDYAFTMEYAKRNFPLTYIFKKSVASDMILLRTPDNPLGPLPIYSELSGNLVELKTEDPTTKKNVMEQLRDLGVAESFETLIADTRAQFEKEVREPLLDFLLCLVISIASIAGLHILLEASRKRDYGVFYTCGSTWRKCLWVDILQSLLLLAVPMMTAVLVAFNISQSDDSILLTKTVYIAALLLVAGIYLLATLGFQIKLFKTKPADCIREAE